MPFYIIILAVLGGIVVALIDLIWDVLATVVFAIVAIALLGLVFGWVFSCFIELFSAVDYVNKANKVVAEAIAQRVANVDEIKKK